MKELNLQDTREFQYDLEDWLKNKFKEAEALTVIGSSKYLQSG